MSDERSDEVADKHLADESSEPADTESVDTEFRESTPNAGGPQGLVGGMGVSSERVGPTGPGQVGTDGMRPVGPANADELPDDVPPEQSADGQDERPVEGLPPKSGYSSYDPRSEEPT